VISNLNISGTYMYHLLQHTNTMRFTLKVNLRLLLSF